jgi:type I restriction enzyme, R subunit
LVELVQSLDEEQKRAAAECLTEDELAVFDLLGKDSLSKQEREIVKDASRDLLKALQDQIKGLDRFWAKHQTMAEVEVLILDYLHAKLPTPPFTPEDKDAAAQQVYRHVWQQAVSGMLA